jgi:hypothetical protein
MQELENLYVTHSLPHQKMIVHFMENFLCADIRGRCAVQDGVFFGQKEEEKFGKPLDTCVNWWYSCYH